MFQKKELFFSKMNVQNKLFYKKTKRQIIIFLEIEQMISINEHRNIQNYITPSYTHL